jgi:hypothetical protein
MNLWPEKLVSKKCRKNVLLFREAEGLKLNIASLITGKLEVT